MIYEEVKNFQTGNISKHNKVWEKSQQIAVFWIS